MKTLWKFGGIMLAVLLAFAWHEGLPKNPPGLGNMSLGRKPTVSEAILVQTLETAGVWVIRDLGVCKFATIYADNMTLTMIGLPNGLWSIWESKPK